jgi:hypothetical protein
MKRSQLLLAGLLLLQVLLILLLRSPSSRGGGAAEARPLLPALAAMTPVRIELGDGEDALDLVRGGTGWTVVEAGGYPADGGKVERLIEDLRALKVRSPVVSGSRYHGTLGVDEDEPEARVRLWEKPSGEPTVELLLGTSPGYRSSHARREGESEVYEVRGLMAQDLRPEPGAWVERKLVDVPVERIAGLSLTNPEGAFELAREGADWLIVEGLDESRDIDEKALDSLLRAVSSLSLAEPVGPVDEEAHGLSEPAAVLTLVLASPEGGGEAAEAEEAERIVLRVGGEVPGEPNQRYLTREGSGFTVTVWTSSVSRILEQRLDELLA